MYFYQFSIIIYLDCYCRFINKISNYFANLISFEKPRTMVFFKFKLKLTRKQLFNFIVTIFIFVLLLSTAVVQSIRLNDISNQNEEIVYISNNFEFDNSSIYTNNPDLSSKLSSYFHRPVFSNDLSTSFSLIILSLKMILFLNLIK